MVQLASDMGFTEGPVWLPGEQRLLFSDTPAGRLDTTGEDGVAVWSADGEAPRDARNALRWGRRGGQRRPAVGAAFPGHEGEVP